MPDRKFQPLGHHNPPEDKEALWEIMEKDVYAGIGGVAVELGAWAGATTQEIADRGYRVYAVDHWKGNPDDCIGDVADALPPGYPFMTFCRNMGSKIFRSVIPLYGTTDQWAYAWQESLSGINFLYIDADHRYGAVKRDIALWSPLVVEGGIIAGHDYGEFEGVSQAVEESGPFKTAGRTVWWRRKGGFLDSD